MSWLRGWSGSARWRWLVAAAAALVAAGAVGLALWPGAAALIDVTAAKLTTQTFTDVVDEQRLGQPEWPAMQPACRKLLHVPEGREFHHLHNDRQ